MSRRRKATKLTPLPLWMRWVAALCLAMVAAVGTAQAGHIHGDWLPKHSAQAHAPAQLGQTADDELHCPVCVAMHAVLPVQQMASFTVTLITERSFTEFARTAQSSYWHYALFSRPPPAAQPNLSGEAA